MSPERLLNSNTYNGPDLSNPFDCDTIGNAGVWINPKAAQEVLVAEEPAPAADEGQFVHEHLIEQGLLDPTA